MNIMIPFLVVFGLSVAVLGLIAFALCKASSKANRRLEVIQQKERFKC